MKKIWTNFILIIVTFWLSIIAQCAADLWTWSDVALIDTGSIDITIPIAEEKITSVTGESLVWSGELIWSGTILSWSDAVWSWSGELSTWSWEQTGTNESLTGNMWYDTPLAGEIILSWASVISWDTRASWNTIASWNDSNNLSWDTQTSWDSINIYIPFQQNTSPPDNNTLLQNTNVDNTNTGWETGPPIEWNISISVADINFGTSSIWGTTNTWVCVWQKFCVIVNDNDGNLWWYVNIDHTDMVDQSKIIADDNLFINTINTPIVLLSQFWSPLVASIDQNNVNFDGTMGHTIIDKKSADKITWSYGLDPLFFAQIAWSKSWSYTGTTEISLYTY